MRMPNYLGIPINWQFFFLQIFKVYFAKKIRSFQKIPLIYYSFFFQKEIIGHTYVYMY